MILNKLAFTSALILISSNALAEYPSKYADLVESAKKHISSQLKDPYSAQFEGVFIGQGQVNKELPIVCGKVNAKNAFGGYVGAKRFYFVMANNQIISDIESDPTSFNILYEAMCTKRITQ